MDKAWLEDRTEAEARGELNSNQKVPFLALAVSLVELPVGVYNPTPSIKEPPVFLVVFDPL